MSGVTLTDLSRPSGTYGDQRPKRDVFGQRTAKSTPPGPPRSMDHDVPDLRRRIGTEVRAATPKRLPLAISGAVIVVVSGALWLDAFEIAALLARGLARIF